LDSNDNVSDNKMDVPSLKNNRAWRYNNMVDFYAHSKVNGKYDLLKDHLQLVAERAKKYAELFDAAEETYLAGILHDLGKYGNLFVRRLRGLEKGIDHLSAGASYICNNYPWAFGAVMSVQGHHVGLGTLSKENIPRNLIEYKEVMPASLRLSEYSIEVLCRSPAVGGGIRALGILSIV